MITSFKGEHAFLSNFFAAPVPYNGVTYLNNEAAFQASKTQNLEMRMKFAKMDPSQAKYAGRRVWLRSDWEAIKLRVMYEVCRSKFTANPVLAEKLLATGDELLIEGNTWNDRYWGAVASKDPMSILAYEGENWLGRILMRVREELRTGKVLQLVEVSLTGNAGFFVVADNSEVAKADAESLVGAGVMTGLTKANKTDITTTVKSVRPATMREYAKIKAETYKAEGDFLMMSEWARGL